MATESVEEYIGECRQALPFAEIYRVMNSDGTSGYTCSHEPPHHTFSDQEKRRP